MKLEPKDEQLFNADNPDIDVKDEPEVDFDAFVEDYDEDGASDDDFHPDIPRKRQKFDSSGVRKRKFFKKEKVENEEPEDDDEENEGENPKYYQCYKCGETIFSKKGMAAHQKSVHNAFHPASYGEPREFQCAECKYMIETEEKLQNHSCKWFKKKESGVYKCDICNEQFSKASAFQNHYKFHVRERKFACDKCDFKAKTPISLKKHVERRHERAYSHMCDACGKGFCAKAEMIAHYENKHGSGEKNFMCEKCGQSFQSAGSLAGHKKRMHPLFLVCTLCEKIVAGTRYMKEHLHYKHEVVSPNKLMPICPEPGCREQCPTLKDFDEHMIMRHNRERVEPCSRCDMTFSTKLILKMHVIEVHHLNPRTCSPEDAALFNVINLDTSHLTSRLPPGNDIQPTTAQFKCEECGKFFRAKRILACHRRQVHETHTHIKCDKCPYSTYLPSLLNKHIRVTHEKKLLFPCDQCSQEYISMSRLRDHRRKVHEHYKPHKCPSCDHAFSSRSRLSRHMLMEHNTIVNMT